jgi:peptidoglycan L-alanyl-D-glutamate endopeptidase CwlK
MPTFSKRSAANLAECHPDLRTLFAEVVLTHDCSVICGERGKAEQDVAFVQKKSKLRWPKSNHNVDGVKRKTSHAADVVPYPLDWKNIASFVTFAAHVMATAKALKAAGRMRYAVRSGGDWDGDGEWKDEKFLDFPHYELVGVPDGE